MDPSIEQSKLLIMQLHFPDTELDFWEVLTRLNLQEHTWFIAWTQKFTLLTSQAKLFSGQLFLPELELLQKFFFINPTLTQQE